MNIHLPRLVLAAFASLFVTLTVWAQSAGIDPLYASSALTAYPPYLGGGSGGPMMMLTASRDHTLFSPIYTDYEDIDGDGAVDYTFKPAFRYYGYFDPEKCYAYAGSRFVPVSMAGAKAGAAGAYRCNLLSNATGQWAGNFLNWATMTRLDVVRKILYGGRRVLDTEDDTTLEMAALAHDAHAFVKYYSGADIGDHTPFSAIQLENAGLTICSRGSSDNGQGYPVMRIAKGNYSLWATTPGTVCNWSKDQAFAFGEKPKAFYQKYGPLGTTDKEDPTAHRTELPSDTVNGGSYGNGIGPELAVRVQACKTVPDATDDRPWGGERCQKFQVSDTKVVSKPIGLLQHFGTSQRTKQPVLAEFGLITGSYDDNFRGGRLRKNIGSINDEVDLNSGRFCYQLDAGATGTTCPSTGSATGSIGGIIQSFDKIRLFDAGNYNAHGTGIDFAFPKEVANGRFPSWGNPMSEMVTQAMAYFAGLPMAGSNQVIGTVNDANVGLPTGVGRQDPLDDSVLDRVSGLSRREMYGRAICRPMHMLAISSGSVTHDTADGDGEDVYGTATAFLSKNVPEGGGSTIQAATHEVGDHEGINNSKRSVGSVTAGFGADCTAKSIGTVVTNGLAQVAGVCPEAPAVKGSYLGTGAAFIANTRAVRRLDELTDATGRSVNTARLPPEALRVRSYAATLSGGVARIEVPIPGKPGKFVYITPESSWDFAEYRTTNGELMPGAMLTFRAIHGAANGRSASYVVTWNDTQFGGDYDMDIVGFLRWEIEPSPEREGAFKLTVLTDILNQEAGAKGGHGFSVMGAVGESLPAGYLPDGRYLTHGGMGYRAAGSDCAGFGVSSPEFMMRCSFSEGGMAGNDKFAWPTKYGGADVNFYAEGTNAPETTTVAKKFLITNGAGDVTLRDPLWYIAKYGSFSTGETTFALSTTALPDRSSGQASVNWDSESNSGQACAAGSCADGEPDGYFLARRPELLEKRLESLFDRIAQSSNAAPATSSVQLVAGSLKYTAEFYNDRDGFGGTITAYPMLEDGAFDTKPKDGWNASLNMQTAGAGRVIITDDGRAGLMFDWSTLNTDPYMPYRAALLGLSLSSPAGNEAEQGAVSAGANRIQALMNYMKGGDNATYRTRKSDGGVMGPIVNSTPWLQSNTAAGRYTDATFPGAPSYRAYVNKKTEDKTPMANVLWVGANDGMLHGLTADEGKPIMSYVPSPLVGRLDVALSSNNAGPVALMDGSPATADVLVAPSSPGFGSATPEQHEWRTYLFSSLGRGGRAVFALDVSIPADLAKASTAPAAFKWVFSSQDDSDLGYQLQDPVRHPGSGQPGQVIYLNSGGFGLLVPNGHGSANGRAALFILSVNGPDGSASWQPTTTRTYYRKITVTSPSGTGSPSGPNGLMGATWVDLDNNGTADVVYATDLLGNLWKFDIRSNNPAEWGSALVAANTTDPVPLFSTWKGGQLLPITTAPVVFFPAFGGAMVSFGTGRAIDASDFPDASTTQRFITVWDKGRYQGDLINPPAGEGEGQVNALPQINGTRTVQASNGTSSEVNTFIKRVLRRNQDGDVYQVETDEKGDVKLGRDGQEVPMAGIASAQLFRPAHHDGWYFDFPSAGEMVINSPTRRSNFLIFTTVRSKSDSELAAACSAGAQGALYAFNPVSGLPIQSLFTTDAMLMGVNVDDWKVTVAGDASGGTTYTTGGVSKHIALGNKKDTGLTSSASNLRLQWREITGMRTRSTTTSSGNAPAAGGSAQ